MEAALPIVWESSPDSSLAPRPVAARGNHLRLVGGTSAPEGMIEAATMRTLLAAAEAVTGLCPLRGHYKSYYRSRAARSPFYSQAYTAFANEAQDAALRLAQQDFASIAIPDRRDLLHLIRTGPLGQRFEDVFFQETLAVFLKTDAWLQLGYPSWEGSARGLDSCRRQP